MSTVHRSGIPMTHIERPTKWVKVSTELLTQLGEWSEPVRVKIESDIDDVLELIFKREEK